MAVRLLLIVVCLPSLVLGITEQGKWQKALTADQLTYVSKSAFKNTGVYAGIQCVGTGSAKVYWMLRLSPCADEYVNFTDELIEEYWRNGNRMSLNYKYNGTKIYNESSVVHCNGSFQYLESSMLKTKINKAKNETENQSKTKGLLVTTTIDGFYLFLIKIVCRDDCTIGNVTANIEIKSGYGYLSALDYPFMTFYGAMGIIYLFYALAWLIFSALYWKDMLRVQFWIAAVIILGFLEKAFFYGEYETLNTRGTSVNGVVLFAEFVSCVKRTLARLLIMVVCVGYGIVLPRLGEILIKVIVLGISYFIFAILEGTYRQLRPRFDRSRTDLWFSIPLAIVDAIIFILTYSYLLQTIQNLRMRRNVVKFNLYRYFSNILVAVVLVSIVFMVWSLVDHKLYPCIKSWYELWLDEAFWHILFSVILLAIIWLWRPSRNNIRYAYSPILDANRDPDTSDEEEIVMDHLTTGELSRINQHFKDDKMKATRSIDDDLQWIADNIPASVAEAAVPLLNSDEELTVTKLGNAKLE